MNIHVCFLNFYVNLEKQYLSYENFQLLKAHYLCLCSNNMAVTFLWTYSRLSLSRLRLFRYFVISSGFSRSRLFSFLFHITQLRISRFVYFDFFDISTRFSVPNLRVYSILTSVTSIVYLSYEVGKTAPGSILSNIVSHENNMLGYSHNPA